MQTDYKAKETLRRVDSPESCNRCTVLPLLRSGEQNTADGIKQHARFIQILFRQFQSEIRKTQLVYIRGL